MQQLLERERETTVERDEVAARKREVEAQIERLSQPGGAEDQRRSRWPNVSAACCCRKFTMTSPSTTRLTSALYGPSRHAIVVPDLSLVREMLEGLEDCPEDLYLIEGIRSRSMTACSPSKSRTKRWW